MPGLIRLCAFYFTLGVDADAEVDSTVRMHNVFGIVCDAKQTQIYFTRLWALAVSW